MDQVEQQVPPVTSEQTQQRKRGRLFFIIVIFTIFIVIFSGIIGYTIVLQTHKNIKSQSNINNTHTSSVPTASSQQPQYVYPTSTPDPSIANWKTYTDPSGFSIQYPSEYWSLSSYPSSDPIYGASRDIRITIQIPDSGKNSLNAEIIIYENTAKRNENNANYTAEEKATDNETIPQVWQQVEKGHTTAGINVVGTPMQMVINGYPAIKYQITTDLVDYLIVAPGLGKPNAEYFISFGNPQVGTLQGMDNPYAVTDPFVQQELNNFEKVVGSIRFKE